MAVERSADPGMRRKIRGVCSLYGGFGANDSRSMRLYGRREDGLDRECIERYWALANHGDGLSLYSVPALRSDSPVPVYLMICGRDPLRDDSLQFARALRALGRDVAVDLVRSAGHGFLHEQGSALADGAVKRLAGWIARKAPCSGTISNANNNA